MTNDEARTNLEKLLLLYDDGMIDFTVIRESIKVAIEALEKPDSKELSLTQKALDCISRQAAIDALGKDPMGGLNYQRILRRLPSVQPESQWIPCSERLPEKPNMYTVTDSKGDVVRFVFYDNESSREYWLRCAKAWLPLPEPYREGVK